MMRSLLSALCILITIICFGCKKENTSEIETENQIESQLDSLSKEKANLKILKPSPQASKDLESFEDFQNLKNLVQTMNQSNPFFIRRYADSVDLLIEVFKENLSEDLNVNPIKSRSAVLTTESGLLMQLIEDDTPDGQQIMDANIRLLTAYNSLIIQLNELSLAIPDNIEKELLRELDIVKDSIADAEKNQPSIE